ncbi:MAG: dTDP-4-dehydrorhamnose reductase [Syntrophobacteraceae bacterium]
MNRNIVVIGSSGMLGADLVEALEEAGLKAVALARPALDITRPESVGSALDRVGSPGLVINCAAYTAVDKAETEPEAAFAANRDGPAHVAVACRKLGVPLLHISTDYVFDGASRRPYIEQDPVNPINVYGLSKLQGEEAVRSGLSEHIIVRTSWLYGQGGRNFVKTILGLAREREELRVVCDQHGCPTWSMDLARCLVRISQAVLSAPESVPWGTYHFCGKGTTTWYEFAAAILAEAQRTRHEKFARLTPVSTSDFPTPAARPVYSVLDCAKIAEAFEISPPEWRKSLAGMVEKLRGGDLVTG